MATLLQQSRVSALDRTAERMAGGVGKGRNNSPGGERGGTPAFQ